MKMARGVRRWLRHIDRAMIFLALATVDNQKAIKGTVVMANATRQNLVESDAGTSSPYPIVVIVIMLKNAWDAM
jgi:hypothetical protein